MTAKDATPLRRSWSTLQVMIAMLLSGLATYGLVHKTPDTTASQTGSAHRGSSNPSSNIGSATDSSEKKPAPKPVASVSENWKDLLALPATPQRDRQLAQLVEELAHTDHDQALSLVNAESNWRLRTELRDAVLRGWASIQPEAAGSYALQIRPEDRRQAVAAVLNGAATQPDSAVKLALRLCAADPETAGDYGQSAVTALVENGYFVSAAQFGQAVGADKYPFLLRTAYFQWARNDPTNALAAAQHIDNLATREQVIAETLSGWAYVDAQALTEFARNQPAGWLRENALSEALPKWVERDPTAATEWINKQESHGELDAGIVAVANLQSLVTGRPTTAMDLAASICDPAQRTQTLRNVFRQWVTNDPAAATRYASSASPADRALLDAELKDLQPN